jgi:hypothetical protein
MCFRWLFPYKPKHFPIPIRHALSYILFQNKITLTLINWLFQGMLGMGRADLTGKIILEIIFFGMAMIFVSGSFGFRAIIALLIAHTLNWVLNSNFWVIGRYIGITRTNPHYFAKYLKGLMRRLEGTSAIDATVVIGGVSREQGIKETSDVDMFFIRKRGLIKAIIAVMVTIKERIYAFFCKFPLHLELYETMTMMDKHRKDEVPYILKDISGIASAYYKKQGRGIARIEEYEKEAQSTS